MVPKKIRGGLMQMRRIKGLDGKQVRWINAKTRSYDGGPPAIDLTRITERAQVRHDNIIYYFAVVLESAVGAAGAVEYRFQRRNSGLAGREEGSRVPRTRGLKPGEDQVDVQLKQGKNLILLKLDQAGGTAGLTLSAEARGNVTFELP